MPNRPSNPAEQVVIQLETIEEQSAYWPNSLTDVDATDHEIAVQRFRSLLQPGLH